MFAKENVHFLLMTLAASIATYVILNAMLGIGLYLEMPSVAEAKLVYTIILLPFGAGFWIAPSVKPVAEGTAVGMMTGFAFVTYLFVLNANVDSNILIEYLLYIHFWEMGALVFVFVTLATICGAGAGWLLHFFAQRYKRMKHNTRAKRFRR